MPETTPTWPDVYKFKRDDLVEGGPDGVVNAPLAALETRTDTLKAAQVSLAADQAATAASVASLAGANDGLEARLTEAELTGGALPRAIIGGSVRLIEACTAADTLLDFRSIAVADGATVPVPGDDSLNLASTLALKVGEPYILRAQTGETQQVQLTQILSPARVRFTPNLTLPTVAALERSTWDFTTPGLAKVDPGEIYITPPLDFGAATASGWGLVIRFRGAGMLDVDWSNDAPSAQAPRWKDAPWNRKRARGVWTEVQFTLPSSGPTRLRITGRDGPVEIAWIVTHPSPEMTDGVANDLPRPWVVPMLPGAGASAALAIQTYPAGTAAVGVVYRVQAANGAVLHTSARQPLTVPYVLPDGILAPAQAYQVTAKVEAADGRAGEWSKPSALTTRASFIYVEAPSFTAPARGTIVKAGDPIALTAPTVRGATDTVTGVQVMIVTGDGAATVHDTGTVPVATALTLPALLLPGRDYLLVARYTGAALGTGPWSAPQAVRATDAWTVTASGAWIVPETGRYQITGIGGGAGGSAEWSRGGTGGGAGYFETLTVDLLGGTSIPVTIGLGGIGGEWSSQAGDPAFGGVMASGKPGGNTLFGSLLTAKGAPGVGYMAGGNGSSGGGGRDETQAEAFGGAAGADGSPSAVNPADAYYVPGGRGRAFPMPAGFVAGVAGTPALQAEGAQPFYSGSGAAGVAQAGAPAPALAQGGTATSSGSVAAPGGLGGTGYGAAGGGSGSVGSGSGITWRVTGGKGADGAIFIKKVA